MAAPEVSTSRIELPRMEGTAAASGPLGKYWLIAELGSGGMARVFLALARGPQGFNKLAVIKQIRSDLANERETVAMFLDEARLAARLNHPNVVQTNEVCEDGERYFICMEYLEGQPLGRILQRTGRGGGIPLGFHLQILSETLSGLHHAHELTDYDGVPLQVVHRDVSPSNVFVTYAGQVKVVDFGIAKALGQSNRTEVGVIKGKVTYMAPEQARGEKVDRRADIFSVGVMMWEALAGRRMFKGLSDISILQRITGGQLPSPRAVNPAVDERLEAVCMKALAQDRTDRYETAADFRRAIEQARDALGHRANPRDAGELISRHFEPERARIHSLVEAALSCSPAFHTPGEARLVVEAAVLNGTTASILPVILDSPSFDGGPDGERATPPSSDGRGRGTAITGTLVAAGPAPGRMARWKGRLALPLVFTLAALVVGYIALPRIDTGTEPAQSIAAATPARALPAAAVPANNGYTLKLESSPAGATVTEGEKALGKTPMSISFDGGNKDARVFVVSLDGFIDYTLRQEPAAADVTLTAALTRTDAPALTVATATAGPVSAGQRSGAPAHGARAGETATPVVPPPRPSRALDIHLTR